MKRCVLAALLAAGLWPTGAAASWREAQSDHFVIYADQSEKEITQFSQQLERYHAAMAMLLQRKNEVPSPSNRVTVYVVADEREVRELHGGGDKMVAGFYIPRLGGSLAIVPQVKSGNGTIEWSMVVLLHEYAHHFLMSSTANVYPRWFNEGAAEFFASSQFAPNGGISIGRPAQHRAGELFLARDVKAAELLDPALYEKSKRKVQDAFYGKSWLLYHYLTFEKERAPQMVRYIDLLSKGAGEREAAAQAFGDFVELERDLDRYLQRRKLMSFSIGPERLTIGAVRVRDLRPGEAAAMPVRIRSQRGVTSEEATALLEQARTLARQYPDDPAVLTVLAECERDAGHLTEAIAAADAAIRLDQNAVRAYVQKGLALFDAALDASPEETGAAYKRAVQPFLALNRLENDHPLPLYYFYRAQVERGQKPSKLAIDALSRALELAPFDLNLRMTLGTTLIQLGRQAEARRVLRPAAASPHGNSASESARKLLARLDAEPTWDGRDMQTVLAAEDGEDEGGDAPAAPTAPQAE